MELSEVSVRQLGLAVEEARELLVFLGAGSSTEGYQDEGRFPDFGALIRRVLEDEGIDGRDEDMAAFLGVMRRWEQDAMLSVRLSNYLHGMPGIPHYQMASLTMSLFPDVNMTVYLTTNYDDLMLKALAAVAKADPKRDPRSFSLGRNSAVGEISRTFDAIRAHASKGVPVLVKLFGDLTANNPIFDAGDMPFDEWTEQRLSALFDRPLLFIGCSLRDAPILRLLVRSRSMHPVFVVSPAAPEGDLLPRLAQRRFCWIPASFSTFVSEFVESRRAASGAFSTQFARFLGVADAAVFFESQQALRDLASAASAAAAARFRSRSGSARAEGSRVAPVERPRTGPDIERFVRSANRILAVVGESGTGKSTLLYAHFEKARESSDDIWFYYDAQSFQSGKSLADTLAVDLMVERVRLRNALNTLSDRLSADRRNLIVLVDAINESIAIEPDALRHEIEALAGETPQNIKFVYSCRRVVWENRVAAANDLPRELYDDHKPFLLGRFSPEEAAEAYEAHRAAFSLRSTYETLSPAVREHVRDPLMLRLIAEAYSGLGMPTFAPAALVFRKVIDRLRAKYRRTPLIDYLDRLVDLRLAGFEDGGGAGDIFTYIEARTDPALALLAQQQLGAGRTAEHPLTILEDENVISPLDQFEKEFKFTYERFYEFLLGMRLQYRLFTRSRMPLEQALLPLLNRCRDGHYSFYQGLRSAFVTEYLSAGDPSQRRTIAKLIFHANPQVAMFAREVLREVVFESGDDALAMLSTLTGTQRDGLAILLDLGYEAEAILPFAVAALFQDDAALRRKGVSCLVTNAHTFGSANDLREIFALRLAADTEDDRTKAAAIIYFAAVLIGSAADIGIGIADAIALLTRALSAPSACGPATLARALGEALAKEGPLFFGANYSEAGVLAAWHERSAAQLERAHAIEGLLRAPLPERLRGCLEAILFFSRINPRVGAEGPELDARQVDYRVVQWLLIRIWRTDSTAVLELLEAIVDSDTAFGADFALGVVEQALLETGTAPDDVVEASLSRMATWTERFEAAPEFYLALESPEPFKFNLAPLAMLAHVQARLSARAGAGIPVLIEWLSDPREQRRRMAVLTANWIARSYPEKVLASLEGFLDRSDIAPWIDQVLAGYSSHAPRLLEEFLERARVPMPRRDAIRRLHSAADARVLQFRPDAMLAWLFLGPQERLDRVAEIYSLMYATDTPESFFRSLINFAASGRVAVEEGEGRPSQIEGMDVVEGGRSPGGSLDR